MSSRSLYPTLLAFILVACGGGGGDGGPDPVLEVVKWTPSGDNQTDTVGQTLPKVIRVKVTLDGALVGGVTVNFAVVSFADGVLGSPTVITGDDGIATTSWTFGPAAGARAVTATVDGAVGSPLTFHATAVVDAPSALQTVSGDDQVAEVDAYFGVPVVVRVVDQFSNGIPGHWVHWTKTGPVTLLADSIITGDQGYSSHIVRAAGATGAATVTATASGLTGSPAEFSATIVSAVPVVTVSSNAFTPANVVIAAGSGVRWTWSSGGHSVTSDGSPAFVGSSIEVPPYVLGPIIFATPGVYSYHCSVHATMVGTVTVN